MNKLSLAKREHLLRLLVEGNSIRGTARITGVSYNTVLKLIPEIGMACDACHDQLARNLSCRRIQIDEIWSFCHTKQKNLSHEQRYDSEYGDLWTFVAIDPETRFVVSWMVGKRTLAVAKQFINDLSHRLKNRVQLSSDGFKPYLEAVEDAFKDNVDYGMLVKIYGEGNTDPETIRISEKTGIKPHAMIGDPRPQHISTSRVERQNLTMRQSMRRFTRSTNGHSKKVLNHASALALHFMHYNYCRIHQTLRTTPAMEARLTDHVWGLSELVELMI